MSFTVILSLPPGRMVMDYATDARTPDAAIKAIATKHAIAESEISDAIVLLGLTGSTMLHRSSSKSIPCSEPTQQELEAAFALVRPKANWKDPIDVLIPNKGKAHINLIAQAIAHFTGSIAEFTPVGRRMVRVTAAGYYASIGA